jgi:hypothetical protein
VDRLLALYSITSSVGAVVALVIANLVPLIGVLFLGWSVWTILIIYWLENGIVGAFNVLKMLRAEGSDTSGAAGWSVNGRPASSMARTSMVPFFIMHYGIFWFVHGVFVLTLPLFMGATSDQAAIDPGADPVAIIAAAIVLCISHAVSYQLNFIGNGEYRRVSPAAQMFAPYGRLVILHVTIILGALAISFTGAPAAAIVILVILKTAMDLAFHLREHRGLIAPVKADTAAALRVDAPPPSSGAGGRS